MEDKDEILNKIREKRRFNPIISKIIADVLGVSESCFDSNSVIKDIKSKGEVDEIDIMEIGTIIEHEFEIEIPDNILFTQFIVVGDFYDYVKKAIENKK